MAAADVEQSVDNARGSQPPGRGALATGLRRLEIKPTWKKKKDFMLLYAYCILLTDDEQAS